MQYFRNVKNGFSKWVFAWKVIFDARAGPGEDTKAPWGPHPLKQKTRKSISAVPFQHAFGPWTLSGDTLEPILGRGP